MYMETTPGKTILHFSQDTYKDTQGKGHFTCKIPENFERTCKQVYIHTNLQTTINRCKHTYCLPRKSNNKKSGEHCG